VTGTPTFITHIQPVFTARCTVCHNATNPTAGLDLTSYTGTMTGSNSGAIVLPGDADNSLLVQAQQAQHFANFSEGELEIVRQWIASGAPEE